MAHTRRSGLMVAASLVAAAGSAWSLSSARAQDAASAPGAPAAQPEATQAAAEAKLPIRFNFKDAPFDQVIDFFSRESGLPVIREADPPQGGMTFISDRGYTFDEALSILNLNLTPRGMQLRRDANFLYLATLKDSARKAGAVVQGQVPAGMAPETIVNLTLALRNAQADRVAEQIKPLIAEYGSVTSVPAQNMVIVVETAAQARRIAEIVAAIDDVRPVDSAYRLFPLQHAKAEPVFQALRGLLGERTRQVFIDKDGRQTVTQDVTVAGLNLQPDTRTNAIIAVGSAARIQTVEELVRLLDVPEPEGQTRMSTFTLEAVRPEQAAERLSALFEPVERSKRPTVITLGDAGKLVIVGSDAHVAKARSLLAEIDPQVREAPAGAAIDAGGAAPTGPARRTSTVRLTYITPAALERIAPRLLTPRQQQTVRFAPTPDDRGVVISGLEADVSAMEQLIATLDVAPDAPKEVRTLRIDRGDPAAVLLRAQELYRATGRSDAEPVSASLDAASRQVTVVGPRAGVDRFATMLASAQASVATPRETRTFMLSRARPSQAVPELQRLLRAVLAPGDGSEFVEPQIEGSDDLRTLVVRATPGQWEAIQRLVAQVDESRPELSTAVLRLRSAEAGAASQAHAHRPRHDRHAQVLQVLQREGGLIDPRSGHGARVRPGVDVRRDGIGNGGDRAHFSRPPGPLSRPSRYDTRRSMDWYSVRRARASTMSSSSRFSTCWSLAVTTPHWTVIAPAAMRIERTIPAHCTRNEALPPLVPICPFSCAITPPCPRTLCEPASPAGMDR
ncbi:hypothetical protein J4558_13790 [Leptolyngbya sp. 15MV]|nr:hypothetical protein J4558_13790 [Leptolyngbya sp. 15MV]